MMQPVPVAPAKEAPCQKGNQNDARRAKEAKHDVMLLASLTGYGEGMRLVGVTLGVLYALVVTGLFVWHVLWERWRER